jgi:hypothetical protein
MSDNPSAAPAFPKPQWNPDRDPCGECHLPLGETCDICGASHKHSDDPSAGPADLDELIGWCQDNPEGAAREINTLTRERDAAEARCKEATAWWAAWQERAETAEARIRELEAFLKRREEELDALGGKYSECAHALITARAELERKTEAPAKTGNIWPNHEQGY